MKTNRKNQLLLKAFILVCITCVLQLTSCPHPESINSNDDDENVYTFDLSRFMNFYKDGAFDKSTQIFTTSKDGGSIGIDLWEIERGFLSDYNCLVIDYNAKDYGFFLELKYHEKAGSEDVINDKVYCPSNLTQFVVPFLDNIADDKFVISLGAPWNHCANARINKITLEKRDNPEYTKSYRIHAANAPKDNGPVKEFDDSLTAWDFLPKMGVGFQYSICAGYSYGTDFGMDATTVGWGYPVETKETIHAIAQKGFKTLRLQTTGFDHVIDDDFTMDPDFLHQLKKVVDWAIEEDMYVIICNGMDYYFPESDYPYKSENEKKEAMKNHDFIEKYYHGAGYNFNRKNKELTDKYLTAFWSQICRTFNNSYDEHLVFETLNEGGDVTCHNVPDPTCPQCIDNYKYYNEATQLMVDTIRDSGGNNEKRYIMISTYAQSPVAMIDALDIPDDKTSKNKFIIAIHSYPMGCWSDTKDKDGNITEHGDIKNYTIIVKNRITDMFEKLDKVFFEKNIPVSFTETGCVREINILERIDCMTGFINEVNKEGRSCSIVMHEEGCARYDNYDNTPIGCNYLDKETYQWFDVEYIDTLINLAAKKDNYISNEFIKKNTIEYESIINKELLKEEILFKDWEVFLPISSEIFFKTVPQTYKIRFEYELASGTDIHAFNFYYTCSDKNYEWVPLFDAIKLDESGVLTLSIDQMKAFLLEGYDSTITGTGFILKSMKVIE